ncbi:MAG: NADH-quinone oxidoreductase subunit J [Puniceicoccales bacterium]|jgi:NADH-quinone oxidoreductase subunit J|nr:NADH-quinone oxidoreductase subunit J [Puniceicoccales bacterium]
MTDSLFYSFAALTLTAALLVVVVRNPVNAAVCMLLCILGVAAVFFILDAPFLGVLQTLVYAGAVMVLFVFIILLFDTGGTQREPIRWHSVLLGAATLIIFGSIAWWLVNTPGHLPAERQTIAAAPLAPSSGDPAAFATGAKSYGILLFTKYMLPVQVAGFLLLSAMIGIVNLGKSPAAKRAESRKDGV